MFDIDKYKFIKDFGSSYRNFGLSFISVPDIEELRTMICDFIINHDRCLSLHSYYYVKGFTYTSINKDQCKQIISMLHTLCIEFTPWQFNLMIQNDYSFECSWTEAYNNENTKQKYRG